MRDTYSRMSPRYIPPEQRAEICRLLAEKWDTGESTLEEIAQELGVSSGTVGRENYVRVGGMDGMPAALERRKSAMGKRAYTWTDKKPGPKPGSPNAGRPKEEGPDSRRDRIVRMKAEGKSVQEMAAAEGVTRQAIYSLLKTISDDVGNVQDKSLSKDKDLS